METDILSLDRWAFYLLLKYTITANALFCLLIAWLIHQLSGVWECRVAGVVGPAEARAGYSKERESPSQPIGVLHSPLPAAHWSSPLSARDRRAQVIALPTRESYTNIWYFKLDSSRFLNIDLQYKQSRSPNFFQRISSFSAPLQVFNVCRSCGATSFWKSNFSHLVSFVLPWHLRERGTIEKKKRSERGGKRDRRGDI